MQFSYINYTSKSVYYHSKIISIKNNKYITGGFMRKLFALLLGVSLIFTPTFAAPMQAQVETYKLLAQDDTQGVQVPIPMNCRVPNKSGSQCVWCSIQTLGQYHKIESLCNLTDKYKSSTSEGPVRRVLDSLNIQYKMQSEGNKDTQILIDACSKGWGAGVGLNGTHMVNIVHFSKSEAVVKIIDNSDSSLKIQTWQMDQFMKRWDGWTVVIVPVNSPPKNPPANSPDLQPRPPSQIKD
jgi:hypothetical protein